MNISATCIRRPVMTTLLMVSILLFGILAYRQLPVSDLPTVDYPTIQVSANVPGASPETMASAVATVLEKQFSTIAGVDAMTSVSMQGRSTITLQFVLTRDIDSAAQDVQAAIARAARQLPSNMPAPPSYQKVNPADSPFLFLVLTSPTLPLSALDEFGQTLIGQRLSMVDGVAQVQVYGGQKYAVRIQADPRKLFARGIALEEVVQAVDDGNVNLPTGILYGPSRVFTVQTDGQLTSAARYNELVVAYRNGAPVRLGDVARATDSVENDKVAAWYVNSNLTQRAIILAVQRQPGMNTVKVAEDVKALLPSLQKQLPPSVTLQVLYDRSLPILASAEDAQFTLLLTLGLVVLVIFIFLRSLSATIIPSLALPMSIVGTFAVMSLLNYSLDNLSLMALTLAIGFVVDDAIVMLENIVRHMEMGKPRLQAALDGSREVGFTILSMTISLAAVFIPVLFMGGVVGRIFREFAVTIGVAVLISGVISLTLTPMLCARFLRGSGESHHGRIYAFTERGFQALLGFYDVTLQWALRHRRVVMIFSAAILALTYVLAKMVSTGFLPSDDQDQISLQTEAAEGTAPAAMFKLQQQVADVIRRDPDVVEAMSRAGGGGGGGSPNTGGGLIHLKPRAQRHVTADQIVQRLRPKLAAIPGIKANLRVPESLQIGGRSSKSQYQYTLQGPDIEELYRVAGVMLEQMQGLPGFQDVTSDMQFKNPELEIQVNRDLASSLGISVAQVENTLLKAYSGSQVSTIFTPNNQYQVLFELLPEFQRNPAALSLLYVHASDGRLVPITALATAKEGYGPLSVNHSGQLPSVTLAFNLKPGVSLGEAVGRMEGVARTVVPPTIVSSFQGTAQAFQVAMKGMGWLLVLAIVVIYIVLGILYESFYHPVTILSALPFAGMGALLALLLCNAELSLYAFVGIIMLVGLVKKNGIMMIDFALEAQREQKLDATTAIHQACLIRFRPIMMTTAAALMAGLPIALGYGAGGESRRPLGLAVVGGLLVSQTLTLYVTPVFFVYMEKFRRLISK
ncbi:MAG: efflux RND transporter permease subunit [Kiritimatiellia bacterium]